MAWFEKPTRTRITREALSENAVWAVVCDGMGGANGGNIASETAIDAITKDVLEGYREGMDSQEIKELLASALEDANEKVYEKAKQDPALEGMGTTAVADTDPE